MKLALFFFILLHNVVSAQNVGIGTTTPVEKLDVSGNTKVNGLIISNGGAQHDFLMKSNAGGQVAFKKGHGGLGLRYIICYNGTVPDPLVTATGPFISEVKIFAGDFAPTDFLFCDGQMVSRTTYAALFNQIGITYGSTNATNFGIPDLRGAVPVGAGTSAAGNTWTRGQ